jgi:hypothetical protein
MFSTFQHFIPGTVLGSRSPFRKSGLQNHYQIMDYQSCGDCRDLGRWLKKPLKYGLQDHDQIMDYQSHGDCRDLGRWLKKPLMWPSKSLPDHGLPIMR